MGKGGVGAVIGFTVGAALSFVGGGPVSTAVWITKGIQGAAVGYSLLSGPSTKHKFGEVANTRSNVVPIPVIYGEHRVGGNIIYERVSDNEKELYVCVGIGEGEVESISDIEVNGKPISEIKGVTYNIYTGTQSQPADSRVLTGEKFPNTAYIAFTFKANDQITSTPNITCVVKGRKVRVWKNGAWVTEFSNNPVWAILDLLTNKRYGLGKDDGVIDLESFKAEAAYCDEIVDGEKRFELDYVVDTAQSSLDILSSIMATFRANLLYSDGQLRLKIEKSELPVQAFTMDNIVAGSFSYSLDSINEMPNQLIGQFSDRSNDWELSSVIYDDEIDQEARGVFSQTLTLAGVTRPSQAGRLIRYYHDLTKLCDTFCEFQAGIDAIHCEAGDVITVSHDVPGWVNKEFLILEMQEAEDDLITLRCRAYDSSIYHDKGSKYQPSQAPSLPNPLDLPSSVTNLQLSEAHKQLPDGTWLPQIRVNWTIPLSINWAKANIWLSTDGGNNWEYIKAVEGSSTLIDVVSAGKYKIKVVSENSRGVQEVFATAPTAEVNIVGKQLKPANVVWGDCSFITGIELNWNPVTAHDLQAYEVRIDQNWGNQTGLIYRGLGLSHTIERPTQRNYTFYIKALDRSGNYSEDASAITLSLPAPQAPQQPTVKAYFNTLKIKINPLNLPSIQGYYVYVTGDGIDDKIPVLAGGEIAYPLESGTTVTIQVSAYDVLGEGAKSEPLQATTLALQDRDIPDDIITPSKLAESLREDIDLTKTNAINALAQISDLGDVVDGALAEIDNTKQRVSDAENDLLNTKNRLSDVEDEIDNAKDRLLGAESRLSSIDDEIADAKDRLTGAESRLTATETNLTDAITRLTDAESDLEGLEGIVSTHETKISNVEGELSTKVSQSEFNSLVGTVTDQGTQIIQNATAITQKADKSTVDTLTGRVSAAEATLSTHAEEIEARATKEEVDTLEGRVTAAEGQLTVQAGKIEAKAEKSEVQALEDDLSAVSTQVGTLTTSYDSISARVEAVEGVTDDLTGEVSDVKSRTGSLEVRAGNIEASVSAIEEDIDDHGNRLATVENAVVNVLPGQIALKANANEVYKKGEIDTKLGQKADSATVSELTTRITSAEQTIDAHAGAIAQKAERSEVYTKTETDAKLGTKVDTTTYNQKVGELTTSINNITGRVSNTETRINNLTGEVNSVKSDVSQLEITVDGIQSTVGTLQHQAAILKPQGGKLWHFDTSLESTDGIKPLGGAVATLRPGEGKFGGAVAVEEGTTNLWSGTSNKTRAWRRNGGSWITFVSDNEILVDFTVEGSADAFLYYPSLNGVSEGPYTFSVEYEVYEFHTTASETNGFYLYFHDASGNLLGQSERLQPKPGERGRLHVTVNNPAGNTSFSRAAVYWGPNMAVGDRVRMRVFNFQIEAKPFATSFVDGTRAAGRLEYPQSIWNHATGTFAAWVKTPTDVTTDRVLTLQWGSGLGADTRFGIRMNTTGRFVVSYGSANTLTTAGAYNDGQWHHVALTWVDGTADIHFYVDGERVASASGPISVNNLGGRYRGVIPIGHRGYTYNDQWWNGLIDELLILPYAATDEEIKAWYDAKKPFIDQDEINYQGTQVTQLADRYSVKIQKTSGGKTYATGFVSGINEQNESEFAVLADRFRVFGTSTSDGQAVFAVDTVTKKAYFLADLIVNGLVRATALETETLKAHMIQAGYAVFDQADILDLETRKILAANGAIEIGEKGIMMIPPGYPQRSMHLDGMQLAFWDINNIPSVVLGDLRQARQNIIDAGMANLFPDGSFPEYGLLMLRGNIAATQSVLQNSLISIPGGKLEDGSVVNKKIGDEAVTNRNVAPKAISLDKLADNIHIPSINETNIVRYNSTTNIGPTYVGSSYVTITTFSFTRITNEYHGEQLKVEIDCTLTSGNYQGNYFTVYMELLGPTGDILMTAEYAGPGSRKTYEVTIDARTFPTGSNTFTIRGRGDGSIRIHRRRIWQNDQLPLRLGNPVYAVGGSIGGCYTGCQVRCEGACEASCQSSCQATCEDTCQASCQASCQSSCQATCEKTSQSGGGCIRQGTPVDVWDLEAQEYITVPVEDLKPGMILPWYQPETDTVIHGELLELQDASYSNEFLRIRTHNGPPVDVTFSQPFDVLADLGQGQKWYKLQAMYLRPGMQLVRPFEEPNNRLSTIVSVETVREPGVHFWNPKTSTGGFCINGYADVNTKPPIMDPF